MPSLILDWILHLNVIYLETFWAYSKVTWCRKLVVEKWCRGDLSVERSLFIHARPEQTPENRAVEIERGLVYKHFLNLVNKTSTSMTKGILSGFWWTLFYTKQIFLFSPIMGGSNFILSMRCKILQKNSSYVGSIWFDPKHIHIKLGVLLEDVKYVC